MSEKLLVGMLGWSAQNISKDGSGLVWFPTGPEDPRFTWGFKWVQHRVKAMEAVRAYVEVIVVNESEVIKEHTPVEVKVMGYIYDDYAVLPYTGTEIRYVIGTQARAADPAVPLPFTAELLRLAPTTNCLVRFEAASRVQHLLAANVQYRYERRCKEIFIQRQTVNGTLTIRALGNEVGV